MKQYVNAFQVEGEDIHLFGNNVMSAINVGEFIVNFSNPA